MRYHSSPKNGDPMPCDAEPGNCPYEREEGVVHGRTKEETRQLYEASMQDQTFAKTTKKTEPTEQEEDLHYSPKKFFIREENLEKAKRSVARANKRLEKAGIEERFEYSLEEKYVTATKNGVKVAECHYIMTLNEPRISYNGYEFEAVLTKEGNGFLTRSAPGTELNGWRPEKMVCEHCNHNRPRAKTFLIKGPDGQRHQIGSTCVDAYLGVKPEGLWAMGYSPVEEDVEEGWGSFSSGQSKYTETDQTLAIALAVSNHGEEFVSSSASWTINRPPTYLQVSEVLHGGNNVDKHWRQEMLQKADKMLASGEVAALRKKIEEMPSDNDYGANLKTAAGGEYAHQKNLPLVASAVSILAREKRQQRYEEEKAAKAKAQEEAKKLWSKGHLGKEGDKIPKGTKLTVMENHDNHTTDYYGSPITTSRMVLRDEEGHMITWFASKKIDYEPGSEMVISSGKIGKTGEYKGVDQTIIKNVRLIEKKD